MNEQEEYEVEHAVAVMSTKHNNMPEMFYNALPSDQAEQEMVILGDVVDCHTCRAYLDGIFRQRGDGFCPACGTHLATLREAEKRKFKLLRQCRNVGCYE